MPGRGRGPIHTTSHAEEFRSVTSKQHSRLLTIPWPHGLARKVQCGQEAFEDTELPSSFQTPTEKEPEGASPEASPTPHPSFNFK